MPRGGAKPGAGRPRERGDAVRAVTVRLTQPEDAALTALEVRMRLSGSEVLRRALKLLSES